MGGGLNLCAYFFGPSDLCLPPLSFLLVAHPLPGHPKHVEKALKAGVDMIIYQGGEGGGHTGDVPLSVLGPRVVDICRGRKSPLTGKVGA